MTFNAGGLGAPLAVAEAGFQIVTGEVLPVLTERRKPTRPQRQRDVLVETVYEIARIECRRLAGAPSAEFRKAVDELEAFDAAEAARTEKEYCAR